MRPAGAGELAQQRLELRVRGIKPIQQVKHVLNLEFLADRLVREPYAVPHAPAHHRPEVLFFDRLVLAPGDDDLIGHRTTPPQPFLALSACGDHVRRHGLELGQ